MRILEIPATVPAYKRLHLTATDPYLHTLSIYAANDPSTDPALHGDTAKQAAQTSSESKPGVYVPQNAEGLEKPKSSEELKAASAELNK